MRRGPFFTIGHSNRNLREFIGMLEHAGVNTIVDVRSFPRSRTNPQFNTDALPDALAPSGIGYMHRPDLGGRRTKQTDIDEQTNAFWSNRSFHNYADYALSRRFQSALGELLAIGPEKVPALMCSEAVWWRCHRRIITDYLLARGATVFHIMDMGKIVPASITPDGQVDAGGCVTYPSPDDGHGDNRGLDK